MTVNGKGTAVLQHAESYQRVLDVAAVASAAEGIRQGQRICGMVEPDRRELCSTRSERVLAYPVDLRERAVRDLRRINQIFNHKTPPAWRIVLLRRG
jgi:hypothetical protein